MYKNSIIYSLSANEELTKEVAKLVGIKIGNCEVMHFADGEILVENYTTVRGKDVYIIQSTCTPATERLMELLIFVDSLKRASAKSITVVVPYYGYSRQDRKAKAREPISAKLMADLLQTAGADRIMCLDLHAAQIQGFFDIPIDNFLAFPIFAEYFVNKKLDDVVVVSPDHGGVTRARKLAVVLDAPIAIVDKRRPKPNSAEIMNIIGDIKGKNCIIIDDMIDTAGTISIVISALKERGAKEVFACCSHALLSGNAVEKISKTPIKELVITNSVELAPEKQTSYMVKLSIAELLSRGILNIIKDQPVSDLFTYDRYSQHEKKK